MMENLESGRDDLLPGRLVTDCVENIDTSTHASNADETRSEVDETPYASSRFDELKVEYSAAKTIDAETPQRTGERLRFNLGSDWAIYNISQPFSQSVRPAEDSEKMVERDYIIARVEPRPVAGANFVLPLSKTLFFFRSQDENGELWVQDKDIVLPDTGKPGDAITTEPPLLPANEENTETDLPFGESAYEDPSILVCEDGTLIMTRVVARQLRSLSSAPSESRATFRQEFWVGESLNTLELAAHGPFAQKGSRPVDLGGGNYGLFNRPRFGENNEFAGGRICFTQFSITGTEPTERNEELARKLSDAAYNNEVVIPGLCGDDEWVGPNQAWLLPDGLLYVIGHVARWTDDKARNREYCAMSFVYNMAENSVSELQIIATKDDFPNVATRIDRRDLDNVVYPGGAVKLNNGNIKVYCGVSDNEACSIEIDGPDPENHQPGKFLQQAA